MLFTPMLRGTGSAVNKKQKVGQAGCRKIVQTILHYKTNGSGTGLGLSLSYDIIKAHGGEIKVEIKEGEGSEFIIQ